MEEKQGKTLHYKLAGFWKIGEKIALELVIGKI